jgi:hypothetical protein
MQIKSTGRQIERDDGVLIFDNTIHEKAWTDENDIMCWNFDHCQGRLGPWALIYLTRYIIVMIYRSLLHLR